MVAPVDEKATFEVEGETITLRLNFRTLSLAKKAGVNLMAGENMDPLDIAVAVRCLASVDHPKMTDEEAFAMTLRSSEAVGSAIAELFSGFAGEPGNVKKAQSKK